MFVPASSGAGVKTRVLFVGNSLTSANDLPNLIAELAKSRRHSMECEAYAPGGYMFSQHAADPRLLEKINQGPWDFIVLQEQSQMPALSQAQVRKAVYPQAKKLCDLIRQANPKARIVFYMTMAKKNGDLQNVRVMPVLSTYQGMQRRINQSYVAMAKQNRGLLAPVGQVWALVRRNKPSLELYSDDTHPNLTGTYLAACVFYAVLFNDSPLGLPHPQPVDNDTAVYLQKIADEVLSGRKT